MTGVEWGVVLVGVLGSVGGFSALLNAFFARGKVKADANKSIAEAATSVNNTAMEWIAKFEQTAEDAQAQADKAKRQTEQVQEQLDTITREARAVAEMLTALRFAIMAPDATIEGLRELISRDPFSSRR